MEGTKVASRYAKSLLALSLEKGVLEQVYADMKLVHSTCKENKELTLMLASPIIKADKKQAILSAVFFGKINEVSNSFLQLIANKRREHFVPVIAEAFINQYKEHKKILTAVITTAQGIDDTVRAKVLEVVKKATNSEVELQEKVDASIIGGFIIRVGDKQDDTSIATKIGKLRRVFQENLYIKDF